MENSAFTEISALEHAWMRACVENNLKTCTVMLADDFVLTSARGIMVPKAEWVANAGNTFKYTACEWQEIIVRPFGEVAVFYGRLHQNATVGGQDWSGLFLVTDVWVKRNDKWQVVSRHETGPLPNEIRVSQSSR